MATSTTTTTVSSLDGVTGTSATDIILLTAQVSGANLDLGGGNDKLILGNFDNNVTLSNVESVLGAPVQTRFSTIPRLPQVTST